MLDGETESGRNGGKAMELLKLLVSLVFYVPLAAAFKLEPDFMMLGVCILFAGFIAAKD